MLATRAHGDLELILGLCAIVKYWEILRIDARQTFSERELHHR